MKAAVKLSKEARGDPPLEDAQWFRTLYLIFFSFFQARPTVVSLLLLRVTIVRTPCTPLYITSLVTNGEPFIELTLRALYINLLGCLSR